MITLVQFALNFTPVYALLWGVPFVLSFFNLFLILPWSPTWTFSIFDAPYLVVINPLALALALHLRVAVQLFVAFWFSMWLLMGLLPLVRNGMVKYNLDSMYHTISSMSLYSIIRATSAYLETLGMPSSISNVIPLLIATTETVGMFVKKNESYVFGTRSWSFFHYVAFKSAIFLALPRLENYVLRRL